jgi:hypothetical protein
MENLTAAEHFEKYGWAYIPDLLDRFECEMLTHRLQSLELQGELKKDSQCPLSPSVYGDEILDKVLELTRPKMSKLINVSLLPAYTYARLYQKNDELKIHLDRPSCEISATITLGHDKNSEIWPIFFSRHRSKRNNIRKIIPIGGGVIYRGTQIWHWREKYEGNWQAQVFLHYVDANGKYADHAYDGRAKLGDKDRIKTVIT